MVKLRWWLLLMVCAFFCMGTSYPKPFVPTYDQTLMGYYAKSISNPVTNEHFSAYVIPVTAGKLFPNCTQGKTAFEITITNLSGSDLSVDWGKSELIYEGHATCGFTFKSGERDKYCQELKPSVLAPKQVFKKVIFPYGTVRWNNREWNTPFVGEVAVMLAVDTPKGLVREELKIYVGTTH